MRCMRLEFFDLGSLKVIQAIFRTLQIANILTLQLCRIPLPVNRRIISPEDKCMLLAISMSHSCTCRLASLSSTPQSKKHQNMRHQTTVL